MLEVKHNQHIDDAINEKLAQLLEDISKTYGVNIHISDTDWQSVYDLKAELIRQLETLGVRVIL